MKLTQFWRNGKPALGIETPAGLVDAAAEATLKGCTVPDTMRDAIAIPPDGLQSLLLPLTENPTCFVRPGTPLAPVITDSDRIFCIGLNYRQHAKECNLPLPPAPVLFNKFRNALAGHEQSVELDPRYQEYDYEAELVVIMGKPARNVSEEDALSYVFGYAGGVLALTIIFA